MSSGQLVPGSPSTLLPSSAPPPPPSPPPLCDSDRPWQAPGARGAGGVTRVLWVTSGYPWEGDPVTGIFFQTQARALARLGVSVAVVAPTPVVPWPLAGLRARWRLHAAAPSLKRDDGVLVIRPRFPNVPGQPSWAIPDRAMTAAALRSRRHWHAADVIHGHYAVEGLAAWRLARRTGLPFFLTFHGDDMNTWPDDYGDRLTDLRAAVADACGVFAVSRDLARRVREVTGVDAIALPIGCDHASIERSSLPRSEARRLLGLPEDRLIVLFVGSLVRQKGVRELAAAILDLGDPFIAAFVGDGPELGFASDDPRSPGRLLYGDRYRTRTSSATCRRPTSSSCRRTAKASPPCSWRPDPSVCR